MSLRSVARDEAFAVYREAVRSVVGLILDRIEWRRANAQLLALEAERMIVLLTTDPSFVAFRKLRIDVWRARQRKHAARAWAQDRALTMACRICPPEGGAYA